MPSEYTRKPTAYRGRPDLALVLLELTRCGIDVEFYKDERNRGDGLVIRLGTKVAAKTGEWRQVAMCQSVDGYQLGTFRNGDSDLILLSLQCAVDSLVRAIEANDQIRQLKPADPAAV